MITEKKMGPVARLCAAVWRRQYRLRAAVRRAGWRWGQQPADIPALCVKPETRNQEILITPKIPKVWM